MDREQIRQLIQRDNLTHSTNILARQLVRNYEELCNLDAQLEESDSGPKDLRLLDAENRDLEQAIEKRKAELVAVEKEMEAAKASHKKTLENSAKRTRELEAEIGRQKDECKQLRASLDQLKNKPAEKERLKRRRVEMQAEGEQLQSKIYNLGEEYQKNADLCQSLKSFVERLEQLERQMEETMEKIWSDLKPDAFDRMF
ncbi:MAG: hypothetical protein J5746_04890 [Victivallales bacterium]|nr:hypothetical protein [Victivallales bacterium]